MGATPDAIPQRLGPRTPRNPRRIRTVRNIVLLSLIVVLVVVGFSVLVGYLGGKPSSPASYGSPDLASVPAGPDFAPLNKGNAVPANVLGALAVPAGSTVVSRTNKAVEAPFDGTVSFTSSDSPAQIARFFPAELALDHWRVERSSNPILGLIEGTDSNYWEVGVTISDLSTPRGHAGGTQFKMELYTFEPGS